MASGLSPGGGVSRSSWSGIGSQVRIADQQSVDALAVLQVFGVKRGAAGVEGAGKNGGVLRPELFIGNYGVTTIFLLSGLSLELAQLKEAALNWKLNALIQTATFVAWPFLIGVPLSNMLARLSFFPQPLLDGLLILSCLPTTVNMCVILTANVGGNMASALCNAVMSNLMGIFATPA